MGRPAFTFEEAAASFWGRVAKGDGCWPWQGFLRGKYGTTQFMGVSKSTHRLAWELANNASIPPGLVVMHSCDNPPCCNPEHLSVGTHKENSADCDRKGRGNRTAPHARGEEQARHKLTEKQILEIRRRCAAGERKALLATEFGVSDTHIKYIAARKTWAWLNDDGSAPPKEFGRIKCAQYKKETTP